MTAKVFSVLICLICLLCLWGCEAPSAPTTTPTTVPTTVPVETTLPETEPTEPVNPWELAYREVLTDYARPDTLPGSYKPYMRRLEPS